MIKGILVVLLTLCLSCSQVLGASFIEEINSTTFSPPDPLTSYNYKEATWTGWNKFWFASAIGGQAADVLSTDDALDRGCIETNPIYGEDPSVGTMILAKALVIGTGGYLIETLDMTVEEREEARNIFYGLVSIVGAGAAAYNYSVDCN